MPDALAAPLKEGFGSFLRTQADELVGRRLAAVTKRADGSDVHTELVDRHSVSSTATTRTTSSGWTGVA